MKSDFFNKKANMKKMFGFTLAELIIVLVVLGVIAAVLMPTIFSSMPDENRLKFKKGYYTLKRTIDAMVNSQAYHDTAGNFGKDDDLADGEAAPYAKKLSTTDDGSTYFCVQFSEMLNSTEAQCTTFLDTLTSGIVATNFEATTFEKSATIDAKCDKFLWDKEKTVNVSTQDGIYWALPKDTFSGKAGTDQRKNVTNYNTIPAYYAVICMDVDGPNGLRAFGFGIRRDGKVIAGARAKEWLKEGTTSTLPDVE